MGDLSTKKGEFMIMEVQQMKRLGRTTKHLGSSTKALTEMAMDEHSESGAYGDYTVTDADGKQIPIHGATAIRVLDHGELNLMTDAGRWYLFAPNAWRTAVPTQPQPGNSDGKKPRSSSPAI
jgi:hypothetical protein